MFSQYTVYVDESGDHGPVSKDYPLFILAFCIFRKDQYSRQIIPAIHELKFSHFGHDAVVLHEREIRRSEPPFNFLRVKQRREAFMGDINALVAGAPFTVIAVAIDKRRHPIEENPYVHAIGVGLAHVGKFLHSVGETGLTHVIVEARGKNEDDDLRAAFSSLCQKNGKLADCNIDIEFASKQHNHGGLQLADLIAYPIGRRLLDPPERANRAYDVIASKFWRSTDGVIDGWGLHCVPDDPRGPNGLRQAAPPLDRPEPHSKETAEKQNAPAITGAGHSPTENAQSQE